MEITHRTNNLRIAPRKLRLVADKLRHQNTDQALGMLPLVVNKGAGLLEKSLKSAVQVAKDNNLDPSTLVIQRIWCDEGPKLKRMIGHSRGRMSMIMKKFSHVSIVLKGEKIQRSRAKARKPEIEEPLNQVAEEK